MQDNFEDDINFPDVPDRQIADSEFNIIDSFLNPESKTSYEIIRHKSKNGRYEEKARFSNFQELNTRDLSNANLSDEGMKYVLDTLHLIDQLEYLQLVHGYNFTEIIRFFRNNYNLFLSASKSKDGTLLRATTTKEVKSIIENRHSKLEDEEQEKEFNKKGLVNKLFN